MHPGHVDMSSVFDQGGGGGFDLCNKQTASQAPTQHRFPFNLHEKRSIMTNCSISYCCQHNRQT